MPPIRISPRTGLPLIPREPARRTTRCHDPAPAALRAGIAQFNAGAYWECHETLEDLWRAEPDPVRYLYQGILLAGVGLLHLQRGNQRGALSKLRASCRLLEPYAPACMGVDIRALRANLLGVIAHLEGLGPESDQPSAFSPQPLIRIPQDADKQRLP